MIDVGGIKFNIDLAGAIKSRKQIADLRAELGKSNTEFKHNTAAQKAWLVEMRRGNTAVKKALTGVHDTASGIKILAARYGELTAKIEKARIARKAYMADPKGWLKQHLELPPGAAAIQNKALFDRFAKIQAARQIAAGSGFAAFSQKIDAQAIRNREKLIAVTKKVVAVEKSATAAVAKTAISQRKVAAAIRGTTARGRKQITIWNRLTAAMQRNSSGYHTWWRRFGLIAVGFAVAYRAIRLFGSGVRLLTTTFTRGLTIMDDYTEGLAIISGMIALTWEGGAGYVDRFNKANAVLQGAMEQAIRLAPKYRLSMEEITAGFRELAQFGVIIDVGIAEKTLNTIAMIKEIAVVTGSTTRQIRQEIQALFMGQARVTDQFTKMIKTTMPELYAKVTDMSIVPQKKWELLIDSVFAFRYAIIRANQTIQGQWQVAQNTISVISMKALRSTKIYKEWVGHLQNFNEQLFNVDGTLGTLGKKLYVVFGDLWTSIKYAVLSLVDLGRVTADIYNITIKLLDPYKEWIVSIAKALTLMFAIRTVAAMIKSTFIAIAGATGISTLIGSLSKLRVVLLAVALPVAAISATMAAGLATGYALVGVVETVGIFWSGFISAFRIDLELLSNKLEIMKLKAQEFAWDRDHKKRINELKAINTLLEFQQGLDFGALWEKAQESAAKGQKDYLEGLTYASSEIIAGFGRLGDDAKDAIIDGFKDLFGPDLIAELGDDFDALLENLGKVLGDGKDNVFADIKFTAADLFGMQPKIAASGIEKIKQEFALMTKQLELAHSKAKLLMESFSPSKRREGEALALWATYKTQMERLKKSLAEVTEEYGVNAEYTKEWAAITQQQIDLATQAYQNHLEKIQRPFWTELTELSKSWTDSFTDALTDALYDFKSFGDSMAVIGRQISRDIARAAITTGITEPIQNLIGTFGHAAFGAVLGAFSGRPASYAKPIGAGHYGAVGMANGGIIPEHVWGVGASGQWYEFGEQGPERVLSNKDSFASAGNTYNISVPITIASENKTLATTLRVEMERTALRVIKEQS